MSERVIKVIERAARELDISARFGEAILAALKAAGIEVVELPEAVARWDGTPLAWPVVQHWGGRRMDDGEVSIRRTDESIAFTGTSNPFDCAEDARSLAAALLAAANAAEAVAS